jgi:hypothetical protein
MEQEQTQDSWPVYEINMRSSKPFPERVHSTAERLAVLIKRGILSSDIEPDALIQKIPVPFS